MVVTSEKINSRAKNKGYGQREQRKINSLPLLPQICEGIQLYDQGALNQNGLASQVLSPLGTGGGYPRPYSSPVSPFPLQPSTWMHPPQQYILQQSLPPMISSSLDPLHYGALMPQLTAHLSQLQLSEPRMWPVLHMPTPATPLHPSTPRQPTSRYNLCLPWKILWVLVFKTMELP
ncbi:hypothetical protein CEXT_464682 [Caerostris extrusa]|uniref:Uncharacterized protein n=1 Tax=Caerostris extrusa TaxID=172846 RepID=A0AAV4QLT4_CAEEX|nr:hypothetical protein CEXT_464682 [Caerostris extrusa]